LTVGSGHRDREVIREREYRDRDETVVIEEAAIATTIGIGRRSLATASADNYSG
jgi:hypothetical protein